MKKSSTNSKIEVSVIIVNYNAGKLLEECVESIVKTTNNLNSPQCEIIIVDNSSTDDSVNFKASFKLIKNPNNPGFSKANNQAIARAEGKYVLLLNPDTVVKNGAISKLLNFAKEHEDAGVVVPKLLNPDGTTQDSIMPFPTLSRAISEFWFNKKVYSKFTPQHNKPTSVEAAVMAAFLITPQAFEKVGILNEKYFMYFEDLDYCRQIKNAGLQVYFLPDAEVVHYHGATGKNLATPESQWKRLIPSSKIYHGLVGHYLINFVLWLSQKIK